ncbi:MAG: DivIVA domain-containing protein [Acidimicrobiales bacterium]|nr:DivIVA domain-containing protein [Acidimicrobiales bacterium]
MTDASDEQRIWRAPQRLTPDRVRSMQFSRTPVGRRGLSEEEVGRFLQRVADDIAARDASEASLRAKVNHYKNTLIEWQREHSEARNDELLLGSPPSPAQPSVEAVNILSRAQQEADAYVAQTQEYCRRLADDARDHAHAIITDAKQRADAAADDAVRGYRAQAGDAYTAELEDLERRLAWARTFLSSLETVETQLRATRQALTYEVDRIAAPVPEVDQPI